MTGRATANHLPVRVVKVGGSLLDWAPLVQVLPESLAVEPRAAIVLIAGGGELAEAIRRLSTAHSIGDEAAHWRCIDAMGITACLLTAILDLPEPTRSLAELRAQLASAKQPVVFDAGEFLRHNEPQLPGVKLPRDWSVTSDSIAARIAHVIAADELVLLKSAEPPAQDWQTLARTGFVDAHFPHAAAGLANVRVVNLRGAAHPAAPACVD